MYGGGRFRKNDAMQQEQYCSAAVVRCGGAISPIVTEGQFDQRLKSLDG
jgi:hypothetical protein